MNQNPSIVVIASTMRSGSTLLKALLAEADDVLNLPETNFQNQKIVDQILKNHEQSLPPIKVLKKPAWYQESKRYPTLPKVDNLRIIVLVRDVFETVASLRKMTFGRFAKFASPWVTSWLAKRYWVNVTTSLIKLSQQDTNPVLRIRYEDLVANPIEETQRLYGFIGSSRTQGTNVYSSPNHYSWKWGSDDGSPNIKSLEVQPPRQKKQDENRLLELVQSDPAIKSLRRQLGYEVSR
ncbi:MAG: sulfotransferase [Planctomycetota bacterium]|nr:sulfotransferase [Planctomycetota bacterium]